MIFINVLYFFPITFLINSWNLFTAANRDFIYSPADLYHLVQAEQRLSKILAEIGNSVENFASELETFTNSNTKFESYSSDEIIKNPLLAYQLVKRHGRDLKTLDETLDKFATSVTELQTEYTKIRKTFTHPLEKDIDHGMEAIVRLRQTYGFDVNEISEGRLGHLQIEGSLSAQDLAEIGHYAKKSQMNTNAKLFLTAALTKQNSSGNDNGSWVQLAKSTLDYLNGKSLPNKEEREDFRVLTEMDVMFAVDSLEKLNKRFESMCQRHQTQEAPISKLKCYLDKFSSPVRQIYPLKLEVYHEDPQIVVIYDFISDSEIEEIESATFYKLKRSVIQVLVGDTYTTQESIIRTTSQTWIHDLDHPQFGYLSKRIESATGFYLSGKFSAEDTQFATYRPGGHYSLHTDALHEEILKEAYQPNQQDLLEGDRVATFMLYLSDVEMGGNTAFPMLNISVRPVKGSAILWGNLYPDGKINRHTLHGACPVVFGVKKIKFPAIFRNNII